MPEHFSVDEAHVSPLLTPETAKRLTGAALDLYKLRPWRALNSRELVFVQRENGTGHPCSVTGMLIEPFGLIAYESIHDFINHQWAQDFPMTAYPIVDQRLSVEYDTWSNLTREDRDLLQVLGFPTVIRELWPKFRAVLPGGQTQHPNEEQGAALADCLSAMWGLFAKYFPARRPPYWHPKDSYPRVSGEDHQVTVQEFTTPIAQELFPYSPLLEFEMEYRFSPYYHIFAPLFYPELRKGDQLIHLVPPSELVN